MASFENWEICQETKLLSEDILNQLDQFKIVELKSYGGKKGKQKSNKSNKNKNIKFLNSVLYNNTNEIFNLKELKKKLDKEGPIKYKIIEYLNMLTLDNYKTISDNIYKIICENIENQIIFLDILFNKSLKEKLYFKFYAKLCKDFDKNYLKDIYQKEMMKIKLKNQKNPYPQ